MNLQQLKAKYAKGTTAAENVKTTVSGTSTKAWDATKNAAVKTGNYVVDVAPATNRRVNSIAAELNAQLNNHEKELFKHEIMIDMIAQATGVNLPDDETLEAYYKASKEEEAYQAEQATKAEATEEDTVESLAAKLMSHVVSAFKKNGYDLKESEEGVLTASPLSPETQAFVSEQIKKAKVEDETPAPKKKSTRKKKVNNEAATTAEEVDTDSTVVGATKESRRKASGRRRLGRQAPLAE